MRLECSICNVCANPGRIENTPEVNQISSHVRKFRNEKFTVFRYRFCGSVHSKEEVDLNYYYKDYPLKQHKLDFWARIAYGNLLKRLIKEGLKPEHKILDYGCGKGLFVSFLHQKGFRNAAGYDPFVVEFSDKKVLDEKYDVITLQDVIEHADNPKKIMEQLVNCLRPSGLLCIGTVDADKVDLSKPEESVWPLHQPYHRHILSEHALLN